MVLFASMIAIKVNELLVFNSAINAQQAKNTNLTGNSIAIALAGLTAVAVIFIILWQKVFKVQKTKETETPENKPIKAVSSRKRKAANKTKGKFLCFLKYLFNN